MVQGRWVRSLVRELRFPHAAEQLSLYAATLSPHATTRQSVRHKARSHMTMKILRTAVKTQHSQINKCVCVFSCPVRSDSLQPRGL